ncbi:unnamed protein product [Linum trigynum]|uniref:Uncharacterized protein n=1 Tax=Linum trigynum TaxID=586398 RepID=A0AAV2FI67_9ROSI
MAAFTLSSSLTPKTLTPSLSHPKPSLPPSSSLSVPQSWSCRNWSSVRSQPRHSFARAALDSDYSSRRSSGGSEQRETIMLPGCDYNHWLIVMEFPKDPAPSRD